MNKARKLRKLLAEPGLIKLPGVYDAVTARVVQHCSFQLAYVTGFGTAAAYGFPDYGLLTMSEMVDNIRRISRAVDLPLIADADTGYGNVINVYRTVQEYEMAGAVGVQFEDQAWPKRCGHMEGKSVIPTDEMADKVKAAAEARLNPETVLVVRTDAIAVEGFESAVERGRCYAGAGADLIFVEAPQNASQIKKIPKLFNIPCVINLALNHNDFTTAELEDMGYKLALFPVVTMLGSIYGALKMCNHLRDNDMQKQLKEELFDFEKLNLFLGLDKYRQIDRKYASNVSNLKMGE